MRSFRDRAVVRLPAAALMMTVILMAGACGTEPPELRLDVVPNLDLPETLALRQPIELHYRWIPGPDFEQPVQDYKVFLHMVDPDGIIIEQDDHFPPVPTSQWTAGEEVSYSRWHYPSNPDEVDYVDFYVGLYDAETMDKIAVRHADMWEPRPQVHRIQIRADDNRGIPVYVEGFHEEEIDPNAPTSHWVWMERRGVVAFGNPRGPAILHFQAHSPVDETGGEPQTIQLMIDEQEVTTLEIPDSTPFLERIEVPAELMGDGDWVELTIAVDGYFVPAHQDPDSTDTRELGLQIFGLYLAPHDLGTD